MIIVYRKTDGTVMNGYNTNRAYPYGLPDVELANVVSAYGEGDYGVISLHDEDDADLVEKSLTHEYWVEDGGVVFGGPRPEHSPAPQPTPFPTLEELHRQQLALSEAMAALFEQLNGGA